MNIAVVGLGLIGGSLCKTIKKHTEHACFGLDTNEDVLKEAISSGVIDASLTAEELGRADLSIICLYPEQTIEFILDNLNNFRKGSIVIDVCGVKEAIVSRVTEPLSQAGVYFIGAHPMAGREHSGFSYSLDNLFDNASFIMTPLPDTPKEKVELVREFALSLRFKRVVISTSQEHDRIIAYTSQLAHIVSSAYIKSRTLESVCGFTAGSFQDLTRVARLNEEMWGSLFMLNRGALISEIETIIRHLLEYKTALIKEDQDELKSLLKQGRILKEKCIDE